ncbi:hypothetical protein SY83_15285 [Paenibacillus swuensis]|uniref:Acid phosphatase n=1 Tax=Paenibacillus swuensis TaxID=1178515 RepID=A0A172TK59_9BACL|nr:divergent PAP2 family protein [Paenibacillus swuensis]ANE47410.1 hypothetical protein SY83_15285 [Paenibacillus swuensis]
MNRGLIAALSAVATAQLLKIPIRYARTGHLHLSQIATTGGMPSSHSAGVCALITYIGLKRGVKSVDFALSSLFGVIVMYDAMGIRRHAGEIAVEVNEMDIQLERLAKEHPGIYHKRREQELKEMLGHLPEEVAAGAVVGAAIGALTYALN